MGLSLQTIKNCLKFVKELLPVDIGSRVLSLKYRATRAVSVDMETTILRFRAAFAL